MHAEMIDIIAAWLLDALIGDPQELPWPHPVRIIGALASRLEKILRNPKGSAASQIAAGFIFLFTVTAVTVISASAIWKVACHISPLLGRIVGIYIYYSCLSTKCLYSEAKEIALFLDKGDLSGARKRTARIVGRDTENLSASEISRAAVESVAENASDGIVAPLFYMGLGAAVGVGPLAGLAYKCVNTMDSMVGYRNERYEFFGKASARTDDVANWIPARLTSVLAWLAAQALWGRGLQAATLTLSDAKHSASPNAGYPEAAFAGALGVKLGGDNYYGGKLRSSPPIGAKGKIPQSSDVHKALKLLWGVSLGGLTMAAIIILIA